MSKIDIFLNFFYLSGMPECKFGLNDKVTLDKTKNNNSSSNSSTLNGNAKILKNYC